MGKIGNMHSVTIFKLGRSGRLSFFGPIKMVTRYSFTSFLTIFYANESLKAKIRKYVWRHQFCAPILLILLGFFY